MPPQEKPIEKITEKPANQEERKPIKALRTYQGDIEEAVAKNNYSASTILVAEQKRKEVIAQSTDAPKRTESRNKLFLWIGAILFVLGVGAVGVVYYLKSSEQTIIIQRTKTLLTFSQEKDILIASSTRDSLLKYINSEKASFKLPVSSILYINTLQSAEASSTIAQVLSLLAPHMLGSLSRSFDSTYMIGIYSSGQNKPFIVLTTSDFASSYAGMLKWENTISGDLGALFDIPQNTGTTTPVFIDEALQNKDLRILQDQNKKTVLLYSFIDRNTLVITDSEDTFTALVGKYLISKQVR